jgi:Helix-turn-helix domain
VTVKTLNHRLVEFFATSPRLADAYRSAARRNKRLARCASIHELSRVVSAPGAHDFQAIILSHPDDDHLILTDERVEPVVSRAFHLLFTEPATHPDQVARWMRATNIRSEHRLHVVRVEDLKTPQVAELLGRVCAAFGPESSRGSIIDAYLAGDELLIRGPKHRMLHIPVGAIAALQGRPRDVIRNFKLDPDGSFIHWPDLDVHLGWNQFLQAVDPAELRNAQQRSAGFNRRYGAAIRKVREAAGIPQAQVAGLTDRQLRRIEHGLCRATTSALQALARTHGLDVNVYLDKLAQAMS